MCEFKCLQKFHDFEKSTNKIPRPYEVCLVPPIGAQEAFMELKNKWDVYMGILGISAVEHDTDPEELKRRWNRGNIDAFGRAE